MLYFHELNGLGHALRLIPVNRPGTPGGDRTKTTTSGTNVSQYHEGGGTCPPTFSHIGTVTTLANSVQLMMIDEVTNMLVILTDREFDP
jgi:hypothetical protein